MAVSYDEKQRRIFLAGQKDEVTRANNIIVEDLQKNNEYSTERYEEIETCSFGKKTSGKDNPESSKLFCVHEVTPACADLLHKSPSLIAKINHKLEGYDGKVVVDGNFLHFSYNQKGNLSRVGDYDYVDVVSKEASIENAVKQIISSSIKEIDIALDLSTANDDEFKLFLELLERENKHLVGFQEQFGLAAKIHVFGWNEIVKNCERRIIEKESIFKEIVSMGVKINNGLEIISRHFLSFLKTNYPMYIGNIEIVFKGIFNENRPKNIFETMFARTKSFFLLEVYPWQLYFFPNKINFYSILHQF